MTTGDPRIDACIAKPEPFAQPILEHERETVHDCCDYVEWITDAKRPDTRARRPAQTIGQLAEGKTLHWKYASR